MAQRGLLAQQLKAIESLCFGCHRLHDKTGTLTEPTLRVAGVVPAGGTSRSSVARVLAKYAASAPSRNLTLDAIADAGLADVEKRQSLVRFRSLLGGAGARLTWVTSGSCSLPEAIAQASIGA